MIYILSWTCIQLLNTGPQVCICDVMLVLALSTQASMLYMLLYFVPDILKKEEAQMREIVDRHFSGMYQRRCIHIRLMGVRLLSGLHC